MERARFFVAHSISACGVERLTQQAGAVNFVYPYDRDIGSNGFCMWQIKPDTAGILELSFSNLRTYDTLFIYENAPETGRLLRKIVPQSSDTSRLRVLTGHCWVVAKGHFAPNNNWDTLSWRVNWRVIHPVIWIRARSQSLDLGTVTGTDPYQSGSMVTVRALQKPGCGFVHWLDELNQTVVSTNQNYTFQATEPKQLMAVFTANCTMTTLNSDVGNFESNGEYSTPQWCSWLITSPNQYKVNLNFRYLNLIDNKHFMYIYDGDSLTGQLLGRYTGNNWNLSFTGYSGKLFIRMVANEDTTSEQHGWSAHWHCDTAAHCIVRLDVKPAGTGNVSFSGVSSSSEYAFQRNQVAGISTTSYQYLEFKYWQDQTGAIISRLENAAVHLTEPEYRLTAVYGPQCSGVQTLTERTGEIGISATSHYAMNLDCGWLIQPADARYIVTIAPFFIQINTHLYKNVPSFKKFP